METLETPTPRGRLIGLSGMAGAGKDYLYAHLNLLFDGGIERVALADGVRRDIEESLGLLPYDASALWAKPYTPEIRALQQWWGTEYRRSQDENFWVDKAVECIEEAWTYIEMVAVTDVRFVNEAAAIRLLGGVVVEVRAIDAVRLQRLGGVDAGTHASEVIDFDPDFYIDNTVEPIAHADFVEWLGLDPTCGKCHYMVPHPWHDDGTPYPLHADFPNPAPMYDEPA